MGTSEIGMEELLPQKIGLKQAKKVIALVRLKKIIGRIEHWN